MEIPFTVEVEGTNIHGVIDGNDVRKKDTPVVLFLVGMSGGALTERFSPLARSFAENGYTFVRFNYRSQEEGAKLDDFSLAEEFEDVEAVTKYLTKEGYPMERFGVVAKSFGAIKALLLDPAQVTRMGFLSPAIFPNEKETIKRLWNTLYGKVSKVSDYTFTKDSIARFSMPIIHVFGDKDITVPPEVHKKTFGLFPNADKRLVEIGGGGDHSMKELPFQKKAYAAITEFFKL